MNTLIERIQKDLHNAREASTMVRASFGFPTEFVVTCNSDGKVSGKPIHIDHFIKEKVKLYMSTWVEAPISRAVADLNNNSGLVSDIQALAAVLGCHDTKMLLDRIQDANHANQIAADR